jgi:hypothetical protein
VLRNILSFYGRVSLALQFPFHNVFLYLFNGSTLCSWVVHEWVEFVFALSTMRVDA